MWKRAAGLIVLAAGMVTISVGYTRVTDLGLKPVAAINLNPSPASSMAASAPSNPTSGPISSPTSSPTSSPISSPISSPTSSPVPGNSASPIPGHTSSPATRPAPSPDPSPASSPASIPTSDPSQSPASSPVSSAAAATPPPPTPDPTPTPVPAPAPVHPSFASLAAAIDSVVAAAGGHAEVSLIELGGTAPGSWSVGASVPMDAASTYKLPALMEEAQLVAAGKLDPAGLVCYQESDWEEGWYSDYTAGACFTRAELANRAGHYSDNTAGHMLVRDLGGAAALNSYASSLGDQSSSFFEGNQTTAADLAQLLAAEATGNAGGAQAQAWFYPELTNTRYEEGIPAGVPAGTLVVHKTGELNSEVNDAAIVSGGKNGLYALAVMTNAPGGAAGWSLVAQISAAVWAYEAQR